jgi:hypothetical protein
VKKPFFFLAFLLSTTIFYAQSYGTAAGVRIGTEMGLTVKQQIWEYTTLEGIYSTGLLTPRKGISLLVAQHNSVITRRINVFYGGGYHKSWSVSDAGKLIDPSGIALIGGMEMSIGKINLSWDVKPVINLWGGSTKKFDFPTAISVRYIIADRIKFNKIGKKNNSLNFEDWMFWKKKNR